MSDQAFLEALEKSARIRQATLRLLQFYQT